MSISFSQNALVAAAGTHHSFSTLVSITPNDLPEYLVVTGLDRERYTVTSNGDRGVLAGNNHTVSFA